MKIVGPFCFQSFFLSVRAFISFQKSCFCLHFWSCFQILKVLFRRFLTFYHKISPLSRQNHPKYSLYHKKKHFFHNPPPKSLDQTDIIKGNLVRMRLKFVLFENFLRSLLLLMSFTQQHMLLFFLNLLQIIIFFS